MQIEQCVSKPELARFVEGDLDADQLDSIAQHVDNCPPCQETVCAISDASNTFVQKIRHAKVNEPESQEAALRLGLNRVLSALSSRKAATGKVSGDTTSISPAQIGPYQVGEQLGLGGMGHVYLATHTKLKRTVALKILPAARWASPSAVSRFQREMEAIGGLDHPNIVRANDAGEENGLHFLAMEFVDGLDLSRLVNRVGSLPVADACELARLAAQGLHYAHENGLVHRDIKPSNLMIAKPQRGGSCAQLKILDLGLALFGDEHLENGAELTTVGTLMGTLDYMSPEQGIDSHAVDQRTDIYGLGATLFKLLTGRAPYADPRHNTLLKKMTALATKQAPSVGVIRTELPNDLVQVVDRMLARDPDDRFQSADEVAEALQPFCKDANIRQLLARGESLEDPAQSRGPAYGALLGKSNLQQSTNGAVPETLGSVGNGSLRKWLTAIALAFAAGFAGILFHIATDYGELKISSDDPNATIVVAQNGKPVHQLQIENGNETVRLRVGTYDLKIQGDAQVSLAPSRIEIARGSSESAKLSANTSSVTEEDSRSRTALSETAKSARAKDLAKRRSEAESLVAKGDLKEALAAYERLVKDHPTDYRSAYGNAKLLRALGWNDLALQQFQVASGIAPSNSKLSDFFIDYANMALECDQPNLAIQVISSGFNLLGYTDAAMWYQMGMAQQQFTESQSFATPAETREGLQEAATCFERAVQLSPDHDAAKERLKAIRDHFSAEAQQEQQARTEADQLGNAVDEKLKSKDYSLDAELHALLERVQGRRLWGLADRHFIQPGSIVQIKGNMVAGNYDVDPDGSVHLGPGLGSVEIAGLTTKEASLVVSNHMGQFVKDPGTIVTTTNGSTAQRNETNPPPPQPNQPPEANQPARDSSAPMASEEEIQLLAEIVRIKQAKLKRLHHDFQSGTTSASELADARTLAANAEVDLATAKGDHNLATRLLRQLVEINQDSLETLSKVFEQGIATQEDVSRANEALLSAKLRLQRYLSSQTTSNIRNSVPLETAVASRPTYQGFPYEYWTATLHVERDAETQKTAIEALGVLGEANPKEAARLILRTTRQAGHRLPPLTVALALAAIEPSFTVDAMAKEIMNGNARSRGFLESILRGLLDADQSSLECKELLNAIRPKGADFVKLRFQHPEDIDTESSSKINFLKLMLTSFDVPPKDVRNILATSIARLKLTSQIASLLVDEVPDLPGLAEKLANTPGAIDYMLKMGTNMEPAAQLLAEQIPEKFPWPASKHRRIVSLLNVMSELPSSAPTSVQRLTKLLSSLQDQSDIASNGVSHVRGVTAQTLARLNKHHPTERSLQVLARELALWEDIIAQQETKLENLAARSEHANLTSSDRMAIANERDATEENLKSAQAVTESINLAVQPPTK